MKMYRLKDSGLFRRTQAEVKSSEGNPMGEEWEQVDVPTNAQGLVDYLNEITNKWAGRAHDAETQLSLQAAPLPATPLGVVTEGTQSEKVDTSTSPYEKGAIRTVSEIEDGRDTNSIVEAIMTCGSHTLGRYAMAVSLRYEKMQKRKKK